jgi:two-component system, chemotaxis family, CheB/CheR fusion protein
LKISDAQPPIAPFPIVGIGASAGGLVALQQFLSRVPSGSGMAYVIVQHLDPNREGMLVELLQRHTSMPVAEAQDLTQVLAEHVYVIPPGRDLSVMHGILQLTAPAEPHGLRLPIDFFFKSLAAECQQHSIGVILSGMGSDGTLGLRAIRQAAGACFVQSPADAQFDSMPRSAIDAGVADVIAAADELPLKVQAYVTHAQLGTPVESGDGVDRKDMEFIDKVISLLRLQTGHDFSLYKKNTILRRIERRMGLHQLDQGNDYLRYLRETPQESGLLFNELLIGVTSFFRDAAVWEHLKAEVIPALLASHPEGAVLRAWVPGCASGEEAYSLAIIFKEALELVNPAQRYSLQIFASDLDKDAIATGRAGVFPGGITAEVSEQRLARFFVDEPGGYRVSNEIREMVIFAEQNIIVDPPFTKLDILTCRNLLIYLESELQGKLIRLFHYSLSQGGFLVLGSAESIDSTSGLFAALAPAKSRIFRRLDAPTRVLPINFPVAFSHAHGKLEGAAASERRELPAPPNLQALVEERVLQMYAPAAVLVTDQGDILYVSGRTGKYLEPAPGKPNMNLLTMAREGLGQALSEAFFRAIRQETTAKLKGLRIAGADKSQSVDVVIEPLQEPSALRGMALVVLADGVAPQRKRPGAVASDGARLEALSQELQQAREDAKASREEMQTSQEELKSTNEELQSANEELQSTNEELTTSKEEMQSMNEELQTVNHELQAKVTELSRTSDDMKNLLDSTEIATLFLDDALNVRRFTTQTTRIIKLIPADLGRPITDIVSDLTFPDMVQDAREVMRTLVFREKDVPTSDGRWFKVRIMPYRTQENRINGLVLTFSDITLSKTLETELRAAQAKLQTLLNNSILHGTVDGLS